MSDMSVRDIVIARSARELIADMIDGEGSVEKAQAKMLIALARCSVDLLADDGIKAVAILAGKKDTVRCVEVIDYAVRWLTEDEEIINVQGRAI